MTNLAQAEEIDRVQAQHTNLDKSEHFRSIVKSIDLSILVV